MILLRTAEYIFLEMALAISTAFKTITERIANRAQTSEMLVQLEEYLERAKTEDKVAIMSRHSELLMWMRMLYQHPRHRVADEHIKTVHNAFNCACTIDQVLDGAEQRLKQERVDIENKLNNLKQTFIDSLEETKKEVERFKDYNDPRQETQINDTIRVI